jgi:hypothetical protein
MPDWVVMNFVAKAYFPNASGVVKELLQHTFIKTVPVSQQPPNEAKQPMVLDRCTDRDHNAAALGLQIWITASDSHTKTI